VETKLDIGLRDAATILRGRIRGRENQVLCLAHWTECRGEPPTAQLMSTSAPPSTGNGGGLISFVGFRDVYCRHRAESCSSAP